MMALIYSKAGTDTAISDYLATHPVDAPVTSVNGETGAVVLDAADVGADPAGTAQGLVDALVIPDPDLSGYATDTELADGLATKANTAHTHGAADLSGVVKTVNNTAPDVAGNVTVTVGEGGTSDHGALTGLADDDHVQYHTDARGDARYSQLGHTHVVADLTDYSPGSGALDTEAVQDVVGAMVVGAGGSYDDGAGTITFPVGSGSVTAEQIIAAVGVVNGTNATSAQISAWEAAGIIVLSTSPNINDTTAPTWAATLSASDVQFDRATITATSTMATDDIGVSGYEYSLDGTTYTPIAPTGSDFLITGLAASTAYTVHLRARDAYGNRSTPALQVGFTTTGSVSAITDTFDRADSVVSLGITDTGQAWTTTVGTAGILSNQARGYANKARAVVDLGVANMTCLVDYVTTASSFVGPIVRYVDENNFAYLNTGTSGLAPRLFVFAAGVETAMGTATTCAVGDRLGLQAFEGGGGTIYRLLVNGTVMVTYTNTNANRPQGTKGGLQLGLNNQTARFDNFRLEECLA